MPDSRECNDSEARALARDALQAINVHVASCDERGKRIEYMLATTSTDMRDLKGRIVSILVTMCGTLATGIVIVGWYLITKGVH